MGLAEVYENTFGATAEKNAAEKKADGDEAAADANEQAEQGAEMTDAQIDEALAGMSDDQLQELAKEVAADVKESQAQEQAQSEKLAEEYFAAGRIFAQGFMAETNGKTASGKSPAISKFASLLEKELGQKKQ